VYEDGKPFHERKLLNKKRDKRNNLRETRRSAFYKKPVRFADYVLVSQEIKVKDFHVPDVEVSDHLPMVLDFEL